MGFGTNLFTWIYFSRDTYNSLTQVKDAIEECNESIERVKKELTALAVMTEPNKFLPEDERDDPYMSINRRIENLTEELEESYTKRYKLYLLERVWGECHDKDGRAITFPKGSELSDRSFMDGDFIDYVNMPEKDEKQD